MIRWMSIASSTMFWPPSPTSLDSSVIDSTPSGSGHREDCGVLGQRHELLAVRPHTNHRHTGTHFSFEKRDVVTRSGREIVHCPCAGRFLFPARDRGQHRGYLR